MRVVTDVGVEVLASSIKEIADGVKKLRSGKLNEKCLLLLISNSSGVGKKEVKMVLDALEDLENQYLKQD